MTELDLHGQVLQAADRKRVRQEVERRTEGEPTQFVLRVIECYEATIEDLEALARMARHGLAAMDRRVGERDDLIAHLRRCRLCDGKGQYSAADGKLRTCLLCDFNSRRVDALRAFVVFCAGADSRVDVPTDCERELERITERAHDLLEDPVYDLEDEG